MRPQTANTAEVPGINGAIAKTGAGPVIFTTRGRPRAGLISMDLLFRAGILCKEHLLPPEECEECREAAQSPACGPSPWRDELRAADARARLRRRLPEVDCSHLASGKYAVHESDRILAYGDTFAEAWISADEAAADDREFKL